MTLMVRSSNAYNSLGYEPYAGDALPEDFVAWGVLQGCVPVFAPRGTPPPTNRVIKDYTPETRRLRRGLCQEALATIVSQKRSLVESALRNVNAGIEEYLRNRLSQDSKALDVVARSLRPALYSDTFWDGRLGPAKDAPTNSQLVVDRALTALKGASVPQVLNIHSTVVFGIFKKLGPAAPEQGVAFDRWMKELRPDELFAVRGRKPAVVQGPVTADGTKPGYLPTTRAGILGPEAPKGGWDVEARIRGVDEWQEDRDRPSPYAQELRKEGLLFVCGPSGTTVGLLVGEKIFADLRSHPDISS